LAVSTKVQLTIFALESLAADLGTATMPHRIEFPLPAFNGGSNEYESGTTDNKFDLVWSDKRTLVATSEDLDLRGVLTSELRGAVQNFVEVCGIFIINEATAPASVLIVGNGTNAAFAGLFNAAADRIKVPASGMFVWFAPLDGGGLSTTATTADILKIDAGAATIAYRVGIIGRSV
jgi:hypothetical protein